MKYQIADLIVSYEPKHADFARFLEPFIYQGDREPELALTYTPDEIEAMHKRMVEGTTASEAESFGVANQFNKKIIRYGAMLVHSSALVLDGRAYLFSAASGVGKSTHTRLWLREYGDRVHIMNDDKPVVRMNGDGVTAYGTPFDGGSGIALNERCPLGAIIFIERGEDNSVRIPSDKEVIQLLYFQTAHMVGAKTAEAMLQNFDSLIRRTSFYVLTCNMEPEAARVMYRALKENER